MTREEKTGKDMNERQKLRWYAGRGKFFYSPNGRYSLRLEDGTYIEIHPDTYDQRFNAFLSRLGVKRTSWSEIMQKAERGWQEGSKRTSWSVAMQRAEQEWNAYCQIMEAFAENIQQWLDDPGNGVFIERPQEVILFKEGAVTANFPE
jgi:hypothetical protein